MVRVSVVGASGYTGRELIRILLRHSRVKIDYLTAETYKDKAISDVHRELTGFTDRKFDPLDAEKIARDSDFVFVALPHGKSQALVARFVKEGKKVVDLSADYRLKSASLYQKWYGTKHSFPELLKKAVYGLPEIYKRKIEKASLVGNPGCYPTGAILGIAPLLFHGLIDRSSIIIDAKSGVSGAGRNLDIAYHFSECHENLTPYNVTKHRHIPEIEQELSRIAGKKLVISFTPHLVPLDRGILTTIYVNLDRRTSHSKLVGLYKQFYMDAPFVRVLPEHALPQIRDVQETNFCEIGFAIDERTNRLIIITAIDNLLKGASGQAVQNMNLMCGFKETEALPC